MYICDLILETYQRFKQCLFQFIVPTDIYILMTHALAIHLQYVLRRQGLANWFAFLVLALQCHS